MRLTAIAAAIREFFRLHAASAAGRAVKFPPDLNADTTAMFGLIGGVANLNQVDGNGFVTITSSATAVTLTAAGLVAGVLQRTGSPGGGVADTTPTAAQIISALPESAMTDGTYQFKVRILNNNLGQTITLTAGSGVTVTGTATIATNAWRDFMITIDSPSAVSITNLGGGSL